MTGWTKHIIRTIHALLSAVALVALGLPAISTSAFADVDGDTARTHQTSVYIVQGTSSDMAAIEVVQVGASVVSQLRVINAVGANLNEQQLVTLQSRPGIRIFDNREVRTDNRKKSRRNAELRDSTDLLPSTGDEPTDTGDVGAAPTDTSPVDDSSAFTRETASNGYLEWSELARMMDSVEYHHPLLVSAPNVHQGYGRGHGVTVAVIDTGLWWEADTMLAKSPIARFDVTGEDVADDPHGHGTHVSSIIASNRLAKNDVYEGIAPDSKILSVRAFGSDGSGTYIDVIEAIDLVVAHKKEFNVRVLNLSFSAPPQSYYWDDPLNQAVMAAWNSGIVVVASAGNSGPEPMSIGVPGNVPYVITVGAMSDNFSTVDEADDPLTSFSSAGPTFEGFVKPEVVAPGGHIVSSMPFNSYVSVNHPDAMLDSERHFAMSGTSQSAAVVSGIVALMISAEPSLSPDDVKCRLMSSARPAVDDDGKLAYSVFQQGAGLVNALAAVQSSASDCANQGLDIRKDMRGKRHYGGPANVDENGIYYIMDENGVEFGADGYLWSRAYLWGQGYLWSQGYMWSRGYLWSQGYIWSQGYLWSRSIPWQDGTAFSSGLAESMGVNRWVDQE